jgi:hypothetical protein
LKLTYLPYCRQPFPPSVEAILLLSKIKQDIQTIQPEPDLNALKQFLNIWNIDKGQQVLMNPAINQLYQGENCRTG